MKKQILLGVMLSIATFANSFAQDQTSTVLNPHQVRFSIGTALEIENSFFVDQYAWENINYNYLGDLRGLPTINLSDNYQAKTWFSVGYTLTTRRHWTRQ